MNEIPHRTRIDSHPTDNSKLIVVFYYKDLGDAVKVVVPASTPIRELEATALRLMETAWEDKDNGCS